MINEYHDLIKAIVLFIVLTVFAAIANACDEDDLDDINMANWKPCNGGWCRK